MASNSSGTIKYIPNVTISGTGAGGTGGGSSGLSNLLATPGSRTSGGSQAFGGYVFSVGYEVGVTSPSKLSLSFVSENGEYNKPSLSVKKGKGYNVAVGTLFNDVFYAYRSEITKGKDGRRLDVMFFDGSIVLDQTFVGLHKKMGDKYQRQPSSLIILGSETHPCDLNDDRVYDKTDIGLIQYDNQADPCRLKCPGQNAEEFAAATEINPILIECQKKYLMNLLDVQYNFAELIHYIRAAGIPVVTPFSIESKGSTGEQYVGGYYDFYYENYTGSLRDVLSRWCDDLALIYYWENGGLNFLDVSKRPKVTIPNFDCVNERTSVETLEGTVAQGAITYYGREGEIYDNDCIDPQRNELVCLTLSDLYGTTYKPTLKGGGTGVPESSTDENSDSPSADEEYQDDVFPQGVDIHQFEISCVCSFYDERLRYQNLFYNYYKIQDPTGAISKIGKRLDRFGGMKILDVFCPASGVDAAVNGRNTAQWSTLQKYLGTDIQSLFAPEQGYFILAELDTTKLENQYHVERNLAANFIGRHWVKAYYQAFQGATPQVTPVGQYFMAGNVEMKDLEFNHFYHSDNSRVATMCQKFKNDPRDSNNQVVTDASYFETNSLSLLYYQKNQVWVPDINRNNPFKTLLDKYGTKLPTLLRSVPDDVKKNLIPASVTTYPSGMTKDQYAKTLVVMAMYPGYEFSVTKQRTKNPGEEDQYYQLVPKYRQNTSTDWPRQYYGLTMKDCYMYTINGVPVYTPAGGSVEFNYSANSPIVITSLQDQDQPPTVPTFAVMVGVTTKPHIEIPKVETTMMSPPPSDDCMKVEYIVKNVNDNNIEPLNNIAPDTKGIKRCTPSLDTIKKFHQYENEDLTFSVTDPFVSEKISVPGMDVPGIDKVSISNGLEGFDIKLDETSAVVTSFSFGNSLFKKVSTDVKIKALELGIKGLQNQTKGSFFSNIRPQSPDQNDVPNVTNQGGGNYAVWQQ